MTSLALAALGYALMSALVWRGHAVERIAIAVILAGTIATPLTDGFEAGGVRWGVTGVDLIVLIGVFLLANRIDRWWLLSAASLQLLALMTHLTPLLGWQVATAAEVTVRLSIWGAFILTFGFGLLEIAAARSWRTSHAPSTDV